MKQKKCWKAIKDGSTIEEFMGWNNFWGRVPDDDDSEQPPRHSCHNICLYNKYILSIPSRVWIFSLSTASKLVLEPTQPLIQWTLECFFTRGKAADHSPASGAEIKNTWSYKPTPP
jgi:hypothetical protein